jgi:hypothetical protein
MNDIGLDEFVSSKEGALNVIEQLRGGVAARWNYTMIRSFLLALVNRCATKEIYQIYSFPKSFTIQRAIKLENKVWPTIVDELGHPPPEKTLTNGRCHQRGNPLLYCSLYGETALAELRAEMGEQYVISSFSVPEGFRVIHIGDFDYYRRTFQASIGSAEPESSKRYEALRDKGDEWVIPALIDAFLADEFIKPATSQTDYKITSAFTDILLNLLHQSDKVDAIMYPSVAFREGANFAVRPEAYKSKLKLVEEETKIIGVTENLGYGIYGLNHLAKLNPVVSGSKLDWQKLD